MILLMDSDKNTPVSLLMSLGISRTEAVTYYALLQLDSVSIRKIAANTGINRGTTYDALKKLLGLGLVSVKQRGSREHYTAESPEKIFDLIRDKRRDLLEADTAAKKIIPGLVARKASISGQPIVRYYEGDEGVVTVLRDVLQTCRMLPEPEYYAYSSSHVRQYLYRKFPQFTKRRIADGIHVKVIAVGEGGEIAEFAERRWLADAQHPELSSYTLIYGNKIATLSITSNNIPYGVVIEDGGAASMQRLLFEQLWQFIGDKNGSVRPGE
jgi:sugar-specific transcriptional regulator TrmB